MAYIPPNPNGQAVAASSAPVVLNSEASTTAPADRGVAGLIVTPAQQKIFRCTFASVLANADPAFFTTIATGAGQVVSQSAGNLVITTGTTVNSETILRSTMSFKGNILARTQALLSQRIINQNFFYELVDVIGDTLVASASSATSLTVTIPSNPFTSASVGQSMYVGALAGGLVGVPNRYAIASVSGNNVTFTVAGFSVTSGTCSLWGWNYYQQQLTNTTATNVLYDAQRRGWNSGQTLATINTTASPGVMTVMVNEDGNAYLLDQLVASSAAQQVTTRASRVVNLPEESTALFLQVRCLNGSVAPASTTTWTTGTMSVENYSSVQTTINNIKSQGQAQPLYTNITNVPAVTVNSGTVTTVGTVTTLANGQTAHSAASTGSPVRVGGRVNTTLDTTLVQGDASDLFVSTAGQLVEKPYSTAENDWQATSGITPLATTTSTALKAAGAASIRNYVVGIQIYNTSATVGTTVSILDGATVIWTGFVPATTAALPVVPIHVVLATPLRGSAATAMNIQCGTVGASVYYNVQGYQSF